MKHLRVYQLAALAIVVTVGCSKGEVELATVQGRVTMDGAPIAKAAVMMAPLTGKGGPAYAVTDGDGRFELSYTHDCDGAVVGECIVRIKTGFQSLDDEQNGIARPETVPAKYNVNSTLKVDVQPGGGPYDFDLVSK